MAKMGERERKKERKKESGRVKETVTVHYVSALCDSLGVWEREGESLPVCEWVTDKRVIEKLWPSVYFNKSEPRDT